jgi:opacity protein-like surface antigen
MRLAGALGALLAISIVSSDASAAGIAFRVSGGYHYVQYDDFNAYADYVTDVVFPEADIAGEMSTMHWIPAFGGEMLVPVVPWLQIGAGVGWMHGTSSFDIAIGTNSWSYEHSLSVIPVTATGYAAIPAPMTGVKPFVFAGGGAYRTTLSFDEAIRIESEFEALAAELSAWGYGFHGGAGLSIVVSPMVTIELGFSGRYATVKGFEGSATETGEESQDAYLVFHEESSGEVLFGPATADELRQYGEGSVDLSGYGFTLGFTLSF